MNNKFKTSPLLLKRFEVEGFRNFKKPSGMNFAVINVFVGPNGSGKSTLLRLFQLFEEQKKSGSVDTISLARIDKFGLATAQSSPFIIRTFEAVSHSRTTPIVEKEFSYFVDSRSGNWVLGWKRVKYNSASLYKIERLNDKGTDQEDSKINRMRSLSNLNQEGVLEYLEAAWQSGNWFDGIDHQGLSDLFKFQVLTGVFDYSNDDPFRHQRADLFKFAFDVFQYAIENYGVFYEERAIFRNFRSHSYVPIVSSLDGEISSFQRHTSKSTVAPLDGEFLICVRCLCDNSDSNKLVATKSLSNIKFSKLPDEPTSRELLKFILELIIHIDDDLAKELVGPDVYFQYHKRAELQQFLTGGDELSNAMASHWLTSGVQEICRMILSLGFSEMYVPTLKSLSAADFDRQIEQLEREKQGTLRSLIIEGYTRYCEESADEILLTKLLDTTASGERIWKVTSSTLNGTIFVSYSTLTCALTIELQKANDQFFHIAQLSRGEQRLVLLELLQDSFVCFEEPETALHPKYQSLLAKAFVQSALGYSLLTDEFGNLHNTGVLKAIRSLIFIETHSEYFIRALQLEARNLYKPKSKEQGLMETEHIEITYFDLDESKGECSTRPMGLRNDGLLKGSFGSGFFDESFRLASLLISGSSSN